MYQSGLNRLNLTGGTRERCTTDHDALASFRVHGPTFDLQPQLRRRGRLGGRLRESRESPRVSCAEGVGWLTGIRSRPTSMASQPTPAVLKIVRWRTGRFTGRVPTTPSGRRTAKELQQTERPSEIQSFTASQGFPTRGSLTPSTR